MLVKSYVNMIPEGLMQFFTLMPMEKVGLSANYESAPRVYRASHRMVIALLKTLRYKCDIIWRHAIEALIFFPLP